MPKRAERLGSKLVNDANDGKAKRTGKNLTGNQETVWSVASLTIETLLVQGKTNRLAHLGHIETNEENPVDRAG